MSDSAHPEIGVCGLSCRLCPTHHTEGKSRCGGCKSAYRMGAGCPFITCAIKKKGIEFCWHCAEQHTCDRWRKHREFSRAHDTFVCYQRLEDNIASIRRHGINVFAQEQIVREQLLLEMLHDYSEGRSKRYYCIAATVMDISDLQAALAQARRQAEGLDIKACSRLLHALLDVKAKQKRLVLKLRE